MNNIFFKGFLLTIVGIFSTIFSFGQNDLFGREADSVRTITTAVPFLLIGPDARSGAMGEAGVAISSDANAVHWNPGKLPFAKDDFGMGLTVTPWLRKLGINDMYLSYLTGYYKLTKERTIFGSLTYFDLGDIQFTDANGAFIKDFNPREFNLSAGYAMKFSKTLGVGMNLKYIYSNLSGQIQVPGSDAVTKPGQTVATDLSTYYTKDIVIGGKNSNISAGLNLSNLGAKITYTNSGDEKDFIPTNLRLGTAFKTEIDPYQNIMFTVDANKLLVPSPPLYAFDHATNTYITDDEGQRIIAHGEDPDRGTADGVFGSFTDAPGEYVYDEDTKTETYVGGSKGKEELSEIVWNFGAEYWYDNLLAFRAGYFHEHKFKGARQFMTVGFGIRYEMLGIDVAYIIPFTPNHPLAETVRIGLTLNMNDLGGAGEEESILE